MSRVASKRAIRGTAYRKCQFAKTAYRQSAYRNCPFATTLKLRGGAGFCWVRHTKLLTKGNPPAYIVDLPRSTAPGSITFPTSVVNGTRVHIVSRSKLS